MYVVDTVSGKFELTRLENDLEGTCFNFTGQGGQLYETEDATLPIRSANNIAHIPSHTFASWT